MHLDLYSDDLAGEVERAVGLAAARVRVEAFDPRDARLTGTTRSGGLRPASLREGVTAVPPRPPAVLPV